MAVRITCINKAAGQHENPYTAISHLGWVNEQDGKTGKTSRLDMYNWIKEGGYAYVKDSAGHTAKVVTAETATGTKYVKTLPDNVTSDNLLKLMECK